MGLDEEIAKARAEIRTDEYSMSIGEWLSIYEKGELDVHPEFQRFFRWTPRQKSRLIESILLGIPIPQVFVAQRSDGIWDVVDGLQRLSTIYQFAGLLRDEDGTLLKPLQLEQTEYLPSLAGRVWDDEDKPDISLSVAQRLAIKRSKIGVSIILKESDDSAKHELFQRLNTGGSQLSDQEVRNSIVVMLNKGLYQWMHRLSEDTNFQECVGLSDRAVDEQYDMELVLRFLVFRQRRESDLKNLGDLGEFLTKAATELANSSTFDQVKEEDAFRNTFALLKQSLSSDSFRRWDKQRKRFVGGFSVSSYEVIALGVGYNYEGLQADPSQIAEKAKTIWSDAEFTGNSGSGITASRRIPKTVPYGRRLFEP